MKIALALAAFAFSDDALAWGLQTHVYLAQYALAAALLSAPALQRAVARFPHLVLTGACLPDLALVGRMLGLRAFLPAHQWAIVRRLAAATTEEERALAVGYASHLLADIVAHNAFVPDHEERIADLPHATHALCEWAMDHHIREARPAAPAELLRAEAALAARAVSRAFGCEPALARRALSLLAHGESALRASPLPRWSAAIARLYDAHLAPRFDAYLRDAKHQLAGLEPLLDGLAPGHAAEPEPHEIAEAKRERQLRALVDSMAGAAAIK
ncbi:MAG: zinc dependent phospholipase C family protein [Betaproteobacteria bacterium]